jgi:hypothetical protein
MKIQILDQTSKKPLANTRLQLQVRGKDSGYLTTMTDANGYATLDDKLAGQQIAMATMAQGLGGQGLNGEQAGQGQWIQANDGAKLYTTGTTAKTTTTSK